MCEQRKFPLHLRPSLGQMGRQFHAGAVKPEPGFCGSGFGFFQSVRCPIRWTKVTDALGTRLRRNLLVALAQYTVTHFRSSSRKPSSWFLSSLFTSPEATHCFSIITLMIIRENKIIDQFPTPKHEKLWLPF